jgi:DNA-binding FadR family transcriptional regulator
VSRGGQRRLANAPAASPGTVEALWARAVFSPVPVRNAFEVTVERLARAIRLGVLVGGERLPPERELAGTFGVSRVTLREAIAALRDARLVESRRGRGGGTFVVAPGDLSPLHDPEQPTSASLNDTLEVRRIVEPGAAGLAASRTLSATDRATLSRCLRDATDALPENRRLADSRLHMAIAAAGDSVSLAAIVADIQMRLTELLRGIPVLPANIQHSDRQHAAIVGAILGGQPARAHTEMEEHCAGTAALLRALLR